MKMADLQAREHATRHLKCRGTYDEHSGDHDCDYDTVLICEECKYGVGRKDPEARCNRSDGTI